MTDTQVTTGMMASMAQILSKSLGRSVKVIRVEYPQFGRTTFRGGVPNKIATRYTLSIEGCHPPAFYGMTANEVKQRMAMVIDMLHSGVINGSAAIPVSAGVYRPSAVAKDEAEGTDDVY